MISKVVRWVAIVAAAVVICSPLLVISAVVLPYVSVTGRVWGFLVFLGGVVWLWLRRRAKKAGQASTIFDGSSDRYNSVGKGLL